MTAPAFAPTHVTHFRGRDIPVIVTREYTDHKGRPRLHVENEHGTSWIAVPRNVHPLPETEPARAEAEADAELRLGLVLLDESAPAEAVNAALADWREWAGYAEVEA